MSTTMINRFVQWLHETPRTILGWMTVVVGIAAVDLATAAMGMVALKAHGFGIADFASSPLIYIAISCPEWMRSFVESLPWSVMLEATIFGLVPLGFCAWVARRFEVGERGATVIFCIALLLSATLCGLMHGGLAIRIVLQGIAGLLYGLAFLKAGGVRGNLEGLFAGWCASVCAHTLTNWVIIHYVAWL